LICAVFSASQILLVNNKTPLLIQLSHPSQPINFPKSGFSNSLASGPFMGSKSAIPWPPWLFLLLFAALLVPKVVPAQQSEPAEETATTADDVEPPAEFDVVDEPAIESGEPVAPSEDSSSGTDADEPIRPDILREPTREAEPLDEFDAAIEKEPPVDELFHYSADAPPGFTGPSGVLPREGQETSHFVPMEDRWRLGLPEWDRYGTGHPPVDDYPYIEGHIGDPYNQNVLKGDYPVVGQHTFLNITATSFALLEGRQIPTATTPFESTLRDFQEEFFGNPDQFFYPHFFRLSFDLSHGDAAFKPTDWRIRLTPIFNVNYLDTNELAIVNPDVREGTVRGRNDWALEEWFIEKKIADTSPDYDFLSVRAGSQFFVSDFRGFIFADTNRAVRLFGTRLANRDQFNVLYVDQTEKETNSTLNTFDDRHQSTLIGNYFRQDFIWPGYTTSASVHYNRDEPSFTFDRNGFLVRPDPVGVFSPHEVNACYLGWAGDGHINRFNISHAFYWALGEDELNPLAGQPIDINAQMAAIELSYDRDWARFRTSFFWASGDDDIDDDDGEGFDTIFDNPNFAGGQFSYWQRQAIPLFGVNLVNRNSLVPDLRSSKIQGQSNFVNPGLYLANFGVDMDLTTKLKLITNVNWLWFAETEVLEQFTFQNNIDRQIGTDLSMGVEWRPFLNNNVIAAAGIATLLPGTGFEDLYNPLRGDVDTLVAGFLDLALVY